MKDAYWFSHDSNARHDPKITRLRMRCGLEGVGAYWCCIEFLREQSNYEAAVDDFDALCFEMQISQAILNVIVECGLLVISGDSIFSHSLKSRMIEWDSKRQKRREAGRKGGIAKAKSKQSSSNARANVEQTQSNALANSSKKRREENRIEENRIGEKEKENTPKPPKGDSRFDSFWEAYGHKIGKLKAQKAFKKAIKNGLPGSDTLITIISKQKEQRERLRASGAFVPEWPNPATWLNGGRWEDEFPVVRKEKNAFLDGLERDGIL